MKIIIQGAGIAGCATAAAMALHGHEVTVLEKRKSILTEGAGILLHSNALKSLDHLYLLDQILAEGHSLKGHTLFLDKDSTPLGEVIYSSIDPKYPAYTGINRQKFLKILYNRACELGANFQFNTSIETLESHHNGVEISLNGSTHKADLLIAADGTYSAIRSMLWPECNPVYTGFGLWHSMHKRHPLVNEKIVAVAPGKRFGIIPLSNSQMYIWGSFPEPEKVRISKQDQPSVMREKFHGLTGFLGDVISEINHDTYVHYTAVDQVTVTGPWHKNRILLIGDAAHASLPFMAQGGAMALQDAVTLGNLSKNITNIDSALNTFTERRRPVCLTVQQMSQKIGETYTSSTVDLSAIRKGLGHFYNNSSNFN